MDADKDGNYSFDNLPVRYTYVRTVGQLGEIADFNHAATEYLAGYTVEVLGNDEDASMSMNGLPATRLQVNGSGLESWAIDGATDPVNSKVVSAEANDATDIYAKGNYPLRWNEDTTQATATVGDGVSAFDKATLGGRIVLAAKTVTTEDDATNADITQDQYRVQATGKVRGDGSADDADVNVDFDFSVAREETSLNAGFGLFGDTTVSGKVWQDDNFNGILDGAEGGLEGKSLTLTQWYYVAGTMTGEGDAAHFVPADGEVVPAGAKIEPVKGDGKNADAVVGAWVKVDSFGLFAGGAYSGSLTTTTDASGAYAFNGLPSFVYAQGAYTADGRTETSANPGIYQPGQRLADGTVFAGPNGTVENDHAVNTDKLYIVKWRRASASRRPMWA